MQENIRDSNVPGAKRYPWEDRALKAAAQFMGKELLPLLGVKCAIKRVAPTEQIYLQTEAFSEDFNYELLEGGLLHLEFESDVITKEDLRRFRVYEALLSYQYKTAVTTCVICTAAAKNIPNELKEGINSYRVQIVRLKNWNADEIISALEVKQRNMSLEREELLRLILTPLMGGKMPQPERIRRSIQLLREEQKIRKTSELSQMQAVLYTLAEKFLSVGEMQKIKEEIHMTRLGQMIFDDGLEEGENRVNRLISCLLEQDRIDDIKRAVEDRDYQKKLFVEMGIL